MQVTKAETYGLRGVIYLAKQDTSRRVPLSEIAKSEDIPEKFLAKIFQYLTKGKIVRSHRGVNGGFELLKKPSELTFCDVIEAIQGQYHLIMCLSDANICKKSTKCPVRVVMHEAESNLRKIFKSYTIADVIK
ncbi:MAG: Rrf2 family transcriptional regulator [candidate division Zixibacteria bacterium]|nr:Rrf2 family transcriptional regulator [candidate division Zixibacteria bacterium]